MEALLKDPSPAARTPLARTAQKAGTAQKARFALKAPSGKIGPNAILQVFACLEAMPSLSKDEAARIACIAGLSHHLAHRPAAMVDERDVVALHQAVRSCLPEQVATAVLQQAGEQTAQYILAHRIPKLAQWMLRALPPKPASAMLLKAIAKHAWTFTGSGAFTYQLGHPALIALSSCPACEQVYGADEPCTYYIATLQGLFQALVHRGAILTQESSEKCDGKIDRRARRFAISWP